MIYYLLITRHTNNPNTHIFWWLLGNKKAEENRQSVHVRALVASNIEHIKYFGIVDNIYDLGEVLFIIPEVKQPNPTMYHEYGKGPKYENESEDDSMISVTLDQSSEQFTLDNSNTATQNTSLMLQYLKVFQKFGEVGKIDPTLNEWNSFARKTSAVESSILKTASLPMMGIMTYFYLNSLFSSFGAPPTWSMGVSTGVTIFPGSILLLLIAVKWLPMVDKEIISIMHGCPPEVEGRFWGQRIAPWLARGASILYFTLPITQFLQNNVLRSVKITNPYFQAALIAPFAYTELYPLGIQIFDPPFTMLANWIATGGQVDLSALYYWFYNGGEIDLSTRFYSCKPFKIFSCCRKEHNAEDLSESDIGEQSYDPGDSVTQGEDTLGDDEQSDHSSSHEEGFFSKPFACFKPFKLCCCFGEDEITENNLKILDRMLGIEETVQDLNTKYTGILYKELKEIGVFFTEDNLTEDKRLIRERG